MACFDSSRKLSTNRFTLSESIVFIFSPSSRIVPGKHSKCLNNDGHGSIPVAIFGSADFDVMQIDVGTVLLEGLNIKTIGRSNKPQIRVTDVDQDGSDDLLVQILDTAGAFSVGENLATLTGNLLDGNAFSGSDSVCIK